MITARVVHADERAVRNEKLIELLLNLIVRQRLGCTTALLLLLLLRTLSRWLIQLREHFRVLTPQRRWVEGHEHVLGNALGWVLAGWLLVGLLLGALIVGHVLMTAERVRWLLEQD